MYFPLLAGALTRIQASVEEQGVCVDDPPAEGCEAVEAVLEEEANNSRDVEI